MKIEEFFRYFDAFNDLRLQLTNSSVQYLHVLILAGTDHFLHSMSLEKECPMIGKQVVAMYLIQQVTIATE